MSSNASLIENLNPCDCINYSLTRAAFCPPLVWLSLDQLTVRPGPSAGLCSCFLPRALLVCGCGPSLGPERERFRLRWPQAPPKDGRQQVTVPGTGLSQASGGCDRLMNHRAAVLRRHDSKNHRLQTKPNAITRRDADRTPQPTLLPDVPRVGLSSGKGPAFPAIKVPHA